MKLMLSFYRRYPLRTLLTLLAMSVAGLAVVGYPEWFFLLPFLFGPAAGLLRADELDRAASRLPALIQRA